MSDIFNEIDEKLRHLFGKPLTGQLLFIIEGYKYNSTVLIKQNNSIGYIIEEWFDQWLFYENIPHEHNKSQSSPDFWLNLQNKTQDLLELKVFMRNPAFDISKFSSFIKVIPDQPYKLHHKYLIIQYDMFDGKLIFINFWIKNLWEICCSSEKHAIRVQDRNNLIENIRPANWLRTSTKFPSFNCLEHFLSAVNETLINDFTGVSNVRKEQWLRSLVDNYEQLYAVKLNVPKWQEIKDLYVLTQ